MNTPQDKLLPPTAITYTEEQKQLVIVPVPVGQWKLTAPFGFICIGPNGGQPQVYATQSGITNDAIGATLIRQDGSEVQNPGPLQGTLILQPDLAPNGSAIGVLSGSLEALEDGAYFTLSTLRADANPDTILLTLGYRLDPVE